eukprot:SAG11_NODE_354_length_10336_cov_3.789391_13_plen_121_part_00
MALSAAVGVLAFETTLSGGLNAIHAAYAAKHPKLLTQPEGWHVYCNGGFQVLEVYAYYLATGVPLLSMRKSDYCPLHAESRRGFGQFSAQAQIRGGCPTVAEVAAGSCQTIAPHLVELRG